MRKSLLRFRVLSIIKFCGLLPDYFLIPAKNRARVKNKNSKTKIQIMNKLTKVKTLVLFRHTTKDGPNETVGPQGFDLAASQGAAQSNYIKLADAEDGMDGDWQSRLSKLFYGWQFQNLQTALGFCKGLGFVPTLMPVVSGLGDDALFSEIITDEFRAAVAGGLSNFAAIRQVHGHQQSVAWAEQCRLALITIFEAMADGQTGVGFFYGIPIVLAAWACGATEDEEHIWDHLGLMEALVFIADRENIPSLAGKIYVAKNGAA